MIQPSFRISKSPLSVIVGVLLCGLLTADPQTNPAATDHSPGSQSAAPAAPPNKTPAEFQAAGVCARCHVVSVLEWGVSGHVQADTDCQKCHGASQGHVANERNEVKPDRLPHGDAIAKQLCSNCHETGCPQTQQVRTCQKCHHVHALVDPAKPPVAGDQRLGQLVERWKQFQQRMAAGQERLQKQDWEAAQSAFEQALQLIPGNHRARSRWEMCRRRLDPRQAGFQIVGDTFDTETGLPRTVRVVELDASLLLLAPGELDLGSDVLVDSQPVHTVRLDPFYLGQHEVTQAQWKTIMGSNPAAHQGDGFPQSERMPVERVSWDDCQEFLRRLNARVAGAGFRLPTEAEWEYACRAGGPDSGPPTESGDAVRDLSQVAWYRGNSLLRPNPDQAFVQVEAFAPRPVGTRRPNSWGFYDMQGNVCEWCSSLFRPYLYQPTDGRESLTPPGLRVLRGGGYADSAAALDPALRHAERAFRRIRWNGLRLARSVPSLNDDPAVQARP